MEVNEVRAATEKAELAYNILRQYAISIGESMSTWAELGSVRQLGYVEAARTFDPTVTPEEQHNKWMAARRAGGWTWGATKNDETREHPNLRPYLDLPAEQRVKRCHLPSSDEFLLQVNKLGSHS